MYDGEISTEKLLEEIKHVSDFDLDNDPEFISDYTKGKITEDIIRIMKQQHITPAALAKRLGKSRQYISRVLNERVNYTMDSLVRLSCALDCTLTVSITQPYIDDYQPIDIGSEDVILDFPQKQCDPITPSSSQDFAQLPIGPIHEKEYHSVS